jgi:hypothetical protein
VSQRRRGSRPARGPVLAGALVVVAAALVTLGLTLTGGASGDRAGSSGGRWAPGCLAPRVRVSRIRSPPWVRARRVTVLADSVLLGGVSALRDALPGWRVGLIGRPALMIHLMTDELRSRPGGVAPLVVVGLGYNSLWERGRRRYAIWADEFDRQARALLGTLGRQGARQVVWVTLRQARRAVIPTGGLGQYDQYAWYFPYVNERLRRLAARRRYVELARWAAVSNRRGLTYDAIHLNPRGAAVMARAVRSAITAATTAQELAGLRFSVRC